MWYFRSTTGGTVLLALCACASAAELSGSIEITRPLTHKRLTLASSVYSRGISVPPAQEEAVDFQKTELRRTVVYVDSGPRRRVQPKNATILQRNRHFEPEVVVVPAGSSVSFPNEDPIFHNVFSLSGARTFDLGNYSKNQTRSVTFDKPGVVAIHCHLHANMSATVVVSPTAWVATPDDTGAFAFTDVPPGRYEVVVWHKSAGFFRKVIRVGETGARDVRFLVPVKAGGE